MKEYLEAGEFVTTHGVTGELKLYPWCDDEQFVAQLPRLFLDKNGKKELTIEAVRLHKGMCLIQLKGVNSLDDARPFLRKVAYFSRADANLPEGRYFIQDIIGCEVRDADTGVIYGNVVDISHPGASDVYTIESAQGERFLFPAVPAFLGEICPQDGFLTVRPIPGMFTDEGDSGDEN